VADGAGRADPDPCDRLEQRHHLGDAPQPRLCRAGGVCKTHSTGGSVRETRQARQRGQRSTRISREQISPEEWKRIAVPALVSEEQFALVQERLQRNSRFSPRNTCRPSLLQGILVSRECGYAYYRCSTRSKNGKLREYYRCSGTDGHRRPEGRVCENRPVRLGEVDELVWQRVLALLDDPALIQAEIDRRLWTAPRSVDTLLVDVGDSR
jgi:site-specific DNA recombinase